MNKDVRRGRRVTLVALAALAFTALAPQAAGAATGSLVDGVMTYTGDGAVDAVVASYADGYYWLDETTATPLAAGAGCTASGGKVRCPASGVNSIAVDLGAGNDSFVNLTLLPTSVQGGPGNDWIWGGAGKDVIDGGDGNDVIDGGWGDDTFVASAGADIIEGNVGVDHVDYSARTAPVYVTLEGGADDGEAGEGDDLRGIERLTGGAGNDVLTGTWRNEQIDGGPGDDVLTGGDGNDTLIGGPGRDHFDGGAGDDAILAKDGEADSGRCGDGTDTWEADPVDSLDVDCEGWTPSATGDPGVTGQALTTEPGGAGTPDDGSGPGAGNGDGGADGADGDPAVLGTPIRTLLGSKPAPFNVARGTVGLTVGCPAGAGACSGSIALAIVDRGANRRVAGARRRKVTRIGSKRFTVRRGGRAKVQVRVSRRGRRALSLRRRTKVQVTIAHKTPAGKHVNTGTITVERRVVRKARKQRKPSKRRRGRGR